MEKYITVKGFGTAEIVEKKSRFIAHVKPVTSEDEAIKYIEETKKQYWDARHNCYAYQLGDRNQIQRYSDDGEPGGTAGMPILDVLRGRNIKNTIIVVTRYFGGTLLGTGGLVRAYGSAAREGIAAAGLIERIPHIRYNFTVDYTLSGKVQYEILNGGHILENTVYTDRVEFIVLSEAGKGESLAENIVNLTGNKAEIKKEDTPVFVNSNIEF
ncbi:MAG: YigZ family protein [Clostridia bacterium]|nr:YigZ family protein [Clostridia bacterium]